MATNHYKTIRKLADDAIALQNKNAMDAALRQIRDAADCGLGLTLFDDLRAERRDLSEAGLEAVVNELEAETRVTYNTSTHPGGDPPEVVAALEQSMSPPDTTTATVKDGKGGAVKIARVKQDKDKPARGKK